MVLLYIVIGILLELIYVGVSTKTFELITTLFILKKAGVRIPITPLIIYLITAFTLFLLFHILLITYVFMILE